MSASSAEGDGGSSSPRAGTAGGLRLIRSGELSGATAQTSGMVRSAAISGELTGATALWMGRTELPPGVTSGDHHHGRSETGIYVVTGTPVFAWRDPGTGQVVRAEARPGDYIWVPPWVPHREENPSKDEAAVIVIARSTQEAIVVNVDEL
jgi:uncharacterized RmlC-like cupin family protein